MMFDKAISELDVLFSLRHTASHNVLGKLCQNKTELQNKDQSKAKNEYPFGKYIIEAKTFSYSFSVFRFRLS